MKKILRIIPFLFLLFLVHSSFGQIEKCFPEKKLELVYDQAGILSSTEKSTLESKLVAFEKETSNQIVVVIVPDLCGYDKADYAIELGDTWQVGQAKEDNGIVILVKPKTPSEKGEAYIAIGRGLEGAIPDGSTFLIVDRELIPSFKQKNYFKGIDDGVNVLMSLAKGEYNIAQYRGTPAKKEKRNTLGIVIFVLFFIGLIMVIKYRQAKNYARVNNLGFWAAWALLNEISRHNNRGGGGGFFGGGGGGFGGGGGGGFGGFGGGSFGGGGAGGSW
jgi:uncharacterized protein